VAVTVLQQNGGRGAPISRSSGVPVIELMHFVPGRLRVHVPAILRDRRAAEAVCAAALSIDGVIAATANPVTGSLVLSYDREFLPIDKLWLKLQARVTRAAAPVPGAAGDRRAGRRDEKLIDGVVRVAIEALVGKLVEGSASALVRALI
jgi:Heavy metal associated domain 2